MSCCKCDKKAYVNYKDNKYEINAENFGKKNWKKWYNKFKKEGLF